MYKLCVHTQYQHAETPLQLLDQHLPRKSANVRSFSQNRVMSRIILVEDAYWLKLAMEQDEKQTT